VSPTTASKWLNILEGTYQWRELSPYVGNAIKRISGKRKGYLCDIGTARYLHRISSPSALLRHPLFGALFETWVVNEIHRHFAHFNTIPHAYHWRTAGGAEVDLLLEANGILYPIEMKAKSVLSKQDLRGLQAFRLTYPEKNIAPGLIIYAGRTAYLLDSHTLALPWNWI